MTPELGIIPLSQIVPDSNQPRTEFDQERMAELKHSMANEGLQKPIEVVFTPTEINQYTIIDGERRWRCAIELDWKDITALIYTDIDAKQRLTKQILGDLLDEHHGPIDRALSLVRLNHEFQIEWSEIDKMTGFSPRRRRQLIAILKLPKNILDKVVDLGRQPANGRLTEKHCRAMLGLPKGQQIVLFNQIREKKLTGDTALKIAQRMKNKKPASTPAPAKKSGHVLALKYKTKRELIKKLEQKLAELKEMMQK
jgi:ParB family chromosome partitioning protein